ncbi:MAG: T9SS-dependent M36 family metallopeptidase [Bacteroidota bacterium]
MYRLPLVLALLVAAPLAAAQDAPRSAALATALDHLNGQRAALGLSAADLADVAVTDEYTSRTSGVTHLYLRQTVGGIEVFNARASAHVAPDGAVHALTSSFVPSAARAANAPEPSLTPEEAVEAAAGHLGLSLGAAAAVVEPMDARKRLTLSEAGVSLEPIPVQLVYFATEKGALRLAWDLAIYQLDGEHWWNLIVDAETGAVLAQYDWIVHDEWHEPPALTDLRPFSPEPSLGARSTGGGATYNVWAYPLEAPSFGGRTLEVNPADPAASPLGWHDDGSAQYTITRGNNVHAYEDRNADNAPGYAPDGGAALSFNFPVDLSAQSPVEYQDAAITNLFYWNNLIHDVMYRYGFDEAAGNFQEDNFGNGGLGDDYVRAEAQDGSGRNNANFGTPPDGSRPRMQMFEWNGSPSFEIKAPAGIAGGYDTEPATFGPSFPASLPTTAESAADAIPQIVPVVSLDGGGQDGDDGADRACEAIINTVEVAGNIALIERGGCEFGLKALAAEDAGAVGVIVHNNARTGSGENGSPEDLIEMGPGSFGDQVTIPAAFVRQSTGLTIVANAPVRGALLARPDRDSDLDNGVIVHEYGHGISNRLTGGPGTSSCLGNREQMGEGWSDYYGLMFSMRPGDTPGQVRSIGTYVTFQPTDGGGIRPFPYSTDMSVNPTTYGDIGSGFSIPHGVGSIWANMLWEMTWDLIAEEGFAADLISGNGGNTIALQLVTEGLKLQSCSPGFVDGRDAILAADALLYGGAYSDIIWRAFARRGLGFSASQGSSNSVNDGNEAFDLPPDLRTTSAGIGAVRGSHALSGAYPNPFSGHTQFTVEVAAAQETSVVVYDAMGRTVARLHDGLLSPGVPHAFELDGADLASGVYVVRATGEHFTATRRITLLR